MLIRFINKLHFKTQLVILTTFTFTIIIGIIVIYNYKANSAAITQQYAENTTKLLKLETTNLEAYISEIDRYSLLLRHSEDFMHIIKSDKSLDYREQILIQDLLKSNFDSRNDLISYKLYLLRKNQNFKISKDKRKVISFYDVNIKENAEFEKFSKKKFYKSILPPEDNSNFLKYFRTIINIEDQEPLAVVELDINRSFTEKLFENLSKSGEMVYIINEENKILFSNNLEDENEEALKVLPYLDINLSQINAINIHINDHSFFAVGNESLNHGFKIICLKPFEQINNEISKIRNISLFIGLFSMICADIISILFIRIATKPLSNLSYRLKKVGGGDFTTPALISGNLEIADLAESFNAMIHQIDDLIKKNYLSELNEKTAKLIALEAQLNPHFLYNALQVISTEAIVNNQHNINSMITSLGSILRYTIKEEDLVMLSREMQHVKDYLFIQQARFGEKLTYSFSIEAETEKLLIPRISIQILVENSIIHGMQGENEDIHVHIYSYLKENLLEIIVTDNGKGIDDEKMSQVLQSLDLEQLPKDKLKGIGLMNLNIRLHLLYEEEGFLTIKSIPNEKTSIKMTLPVKS